MNRFRRLSAVGVAIVLGLVVGGCGTAKAAPDPGFAGHWTSSQWGEHYILVDGATTKIIYEHDDGRILGVLDGSKVTGWWTESPSRQPTRDAGTVTFTLTVSGDTRTIDGEWRYGADGNPRQNWDLTWVGADIPADIVARFSDATGFVRHP